ncbi:MAG: YigZ family protein, partial [Desulfobacterales bacterium]|nr:YigZ family protein [Desulfobacterales bacterium]
AYVVGDQGEISHASDAGEPAGTAGKPMLNTLLSHDMTCVAAVVTRHYGGVKLGVRGLIDAYARSVLAAIEQAPLVKLVKTVPFRVELPYGINDTFMSRIKSFRAEILQTEYKETVSHDLAVELDDVDRVDAFLLEYQHQGKLTYERGDDA